MSGEWNKLNRLKEDLAGFDSVAVAFSSGVDSTFLLWVAREVLGENVIAVTARSCLFPRREQEEAADFCKMAGIRHFIFEFRESAIDGFCENNPNRCYLCKKRLFREILRIAGEQDIHVAADGSNVDDEGDYRPGLMAAAELGIRSPLREAGFSKAEIRGLSKEMGLSTWEKPSYACLASRIPYGDRITEKKLGMVERAEQWLSDRGFRQCRVRLHGNMARIEVMPDEFDRLIERRMREEAVSAFQSYGFSYVSMDLSGYRTGSMNETIRHVPASLI